MRYSRQNKVLELINEYEIETQEKLCQLLKEAGYDVTQATVSRDIKEMQLVKTLSSSGKYKYAQSRENGPISDRFVKIFKGTIKSVTPAENIIVVKTLSGCAAAAGEAVDSLGLPHVAGCVAGDNTLMIIAEERRYVPDLVEQFENILK
ncbi:MAG: arginine repressor [Eubacteriales bacterium]|nr:arginine repressor [Eubacteriales bacterium]